MDSCHFSSEEREALKQEIFSSLHCALPGTVETFDPEKERYYTTEELQAMGVLVVEPWSDQVVYSPTAIMRLENDGVSHPSAKLLLIVIGVALVLVIIIFIVFIILICRLIRKLLRKPSKRSDVLAVCPKDKDISQS